MAANAGPFGVLLDIDGVLYVGDEPIDGAHQALARLRRLSRGLRLVTNTTSRSRRVVFEHLRELGFDVRLEEVLTPAALAVRYCEEHAYKSVALLVSDSLREDLDALGERPRVGHVEAVILGDLGSGFTAGVLNDAFRMLMDGAQLIALQHNRYWRRTDGLALDVGAYAAALEYASGREAVVVGKPSPAFFSAALADMALERGVMIGDDVEADVAGAIASGLSGVLVRTGKYREEALAGCPTRPTAVADSISEVADLLVGLFAA